MNYEPFNTTDPESNSVVSQAKSKKRSPAMVLATISLFLSVAMMLALAGTIVYISKQSDRYFADNQDPTKQENRDGTSGLQDTNRISSQELQQAEITIDENSYALSTIVSAVRPSVVCVCVTVPSQTIDYGFSYYETEASTSTGSGIIWTADGYIITNQHVIEYAQEYDTAYITVLFDDGTEADATLIAADSQTDLALIKVETDTALSAVTIGSSANLLVGETAIAIGNPLGIEYANSVTVGIVSGLNRQVSGENGVSTMIQTDAAVNPGNSGGALVDAAGEVIGIVSAKIASTEVEGIGFAIPIDDAISIITNLKEYGYVKGRPATGIAAGTEITASMSRRYRLPQGLYVTEITKGSGAEVAGIQKYDIILSLDGIPVTTLDQIEEIKKQHKVGDTITVSYYRSGKTKETSLTLTEDKG